ncbi:DEAD/DEAH box helicase [Nocardioides daeguensis]|uniref:DEAD/DEAH box helicase n=1 Tax=Nocardioides daeguensis TaxID=908359 RepID=A0ABP6WF55_9ACTN|nr:DEAD/DEAH box helicase [Nocardioides daeguensis]MBV6727919.1 DEAD/DEAH box helicase [Nocardioides daeguensis]MCR1771662.1 DEAD/DEAH box helicase [Nocardioides daeguensis]
MSFVPVSGPATFRPGDPATIEFTDAAGDRRIALPVSAALPVLSRSRTADDAHPSVRLLSGAALLGLRLVAAGKVAPDAGGRAWRVEGLDPRDQDAVERLARSFDADDELVREMLDAVADTLPRAAPSAPRSPAPVAAGTPEEFAERVRRRLAERRDDAVLPELVRISLRVEADEEELVAGTVRLVLQVHDERDPLHVCDAALLWTGGAAEHGFGRRARVHASIALRAAADAWPVLDRLLGLAVPDQLTLDGAEIGSLLEHVGALRDARVDVHWPRALGPELTTRAVLDRRRERGGPARGEELPLQDSPFSTEGLFSFSWQVSLHGEALTSDEMAELAKAASPVIKLRGAWTVVDPTTAERARRRLIRKASGAQALAAALTGVTELPTAGDEQPDTTEVVVGASLLKVREQILAAATRAPVAEPAGLAAHLRDYQRHGLTWLADLTGLGLGACLADDMGLGKTITLISLHLHRLEQGRSDGGPTLVVCPASLLGNWEAEVERFAPGVPVRRFHGGARSLEGLDRPGQRGGGFVLTTYGTLRRDAETLAGVAWDLVVADEAQHVKNSRTSTARALRRLPARARVALTGTPVENDLTELWSILDWCVPGLLGSRQAFRRVWGAPIESGAEPTKARQFADLIGPFLLRRRKSDPGIAPELPPKTETDHLLGLTREQVVLYEAFVKDTMERIERADEETRRGLVLALLTGLKQICNHPAQFLKQSGAVRLTGRSEKLELLDELVATVLAEDGAVLVFTQYVALARLVEQHLTALGVPHQFLHGGTPVAQREAMVRRFQAAEVPVFLLSLKAGGTGLNLTRADHVVHFDRWWNPAVEEQATDRAYRIGQTRPVQVHRMVTRGTIEERVAQLLDRKRQLADAVLARGDAALTELSNEELRDLVTLRRQAREAVDAEVGD